MPNGTQKAGNTLARTAFLLVLYGVEIALAILASLSLFRAVAAENWWMLGLNVWQVVFALFVMYLLGARAHMFIRDFVLFVVVSSLLLVILRSVWQAVGDAEDAEEISEGSERDLFMTYLALAGIRLVVFLMNTVSIIKILFYRKAKRTKPENEQLLQGVQK
jgi:hypothetical protein